MNRKTLRSSILLTALLTASAAFAGADIVKCVDKDGQVTLTDSQCGAGVQTVLVAASVDTPAAQPADAQPEQAEVQPEAPVARRSIERIVVSPPQINRDNWSGHRQNARMMARDVETLKAARLSMQVLDEASASMRQQRLAGR